MTALLHIAEAEKSPRIWVDEFVHALGELGELEIVENGARLPEEKLAARIRECEVLLTGWGSVTIPVSAAARPGRLRYVCNLTGTVRRYVPLEVIEADIPVTNWGDAPAGRVAEATLALLLAVLKNIPGRVEIIRSGGWRPPEGFRSASLASLDLGLYGCGVIARRFLAMLRPLAPTVRVFDPYAAELPEGVARAESLEELFSKSEAVVIGAALNDETAGTVTAELLARLPDGGVLINTARGEIVDQEAIFREVLSGRLRAGLDVLYEQPGEDPALPAGHPARDCPNLILTAHALSKIDPAPEKLQEMHRICLENIRRHLAGDPLRFVVDRVRYERST